MSPRPVSCRHRAAGRTARLVTRSSQVDLSFLDVPNIDGDLQSVLTELGASFNDDGVAATYGNARQAVEAPGSGVALVDRSHWPRLRLSGRDRIPLLQRCTTQDFSNLTAGQGCDTVLLDSNGHALDLATALISDSHVLLVVSPGGGPAAAAWLQQQAAACELKVQVQDVSQRCCLLTLVGPESANVLKELMGESLLSSLGTAYGAHTLLNFRSTPLLVAVGCGLPFPGYTLIAAESVAGELFSVLAVKGCILMGDDEWECTRVLAGRPALDKELGVGRSPLEAGLYHAISLGKAIGTEGMQALANSHARGHGSQLWGLQLQAAAAPGAEVTLGGHPVGSVSSANTSPTSSHFGLAYIQTEAVLSGTANQPTIEGLSVQVGEADATVAAIPFASRAFLTDLLSAAGTSQATAAVALGPGAEVMAQQAEQERMRQAQEAATAEQARLQRVQENAAKLAAWQAQQLGQIRARR